MVGTVASGDGEVDAALPLCNGCEGGAPFGSLPGQFGGWRSRSRLASRRAWIWATASSWLMCWTGSGMAAGFARGVERRFEVAGAFCTVAGAAAFRALPLATDDDALRAGAFVVAAWRATGAFAVLRAGERVDDVVVAVVRAGVFRVAARAVGPFVATLRAVVFVTFFAEAALRTGAFFEGDVLVDAFFAAGFLTAPFARAVFFAGAFFVAAFFAPTFFTAAFFTAAFFAAVFFTAAFFAGAFFTAALFATAFFATVFFDAALRAADVFFAADLRVVAMRSFLLR